MMEDLARQLTELGFHFHHEGNRIRCVYPQVIKGL